MIDCLINTLISLELYIPSKQIIHQIKAYIFLYRMIHESCICENVDLKGIFSLLFFELRFLA